MIKTLSINELKEIKDREGLVLQGCGGDQQEWVNGINDLFTEENLLLDGDRFEEVYTFENDGLTNMLFMMDNVKLDIGKLAMWRLSNHSNFGGTWFSDYLPNKLGVNIDEPVQESNKPDCPLIGADGNIFNLMGIASRTLKRSGLGEQSTEMCSRVMSSGSYDEALCIIGDYVNITSAEEMNDEECGMGLE